MCQNNLSFLNTQAEGFFSSSFHYKNKISISDCVISMTGDRSYHREEGEALGAWHIHTLIMSQVDYRATVRPNLFHSVTYDVWFDHKHERRLDVLHLEFGESSRLQIFPRFPGGLASVTEVVPKRLENVLEEVRPGGRVRHNVLHKEEGPTLQIRHVLCVPHLKKKIRGSEFKD